MSTGNQMARRTSGQPSRASVEALALAALRALPEASAMVFDTDLRYVIVRGAALASHGFTPEDLEGRIAAEALDPEQWAFYEPLYRAALLGETHSAEVPSQNGQRCLLAEVGPLRADDDEIVGGVAFTADITPQKHAEERFRAVLECAPDATVILDGEGRVVLVNAQAEVVFGYTREELLGEPVEILLPERFRERHAHERALYSSDPGAGAPHARSMGIGHNGVYGQRKDGSEFPAEVSLSPLETADGTLFASAIRDITERRRADRNAAHFAAVVESSHDAIVSTDLEGTVMSWNSGAERLYGYGESEVRGRPISVLVPPGRDDELTEILRRVGLDEAIEEYETVRARKDGTLVDVSLTISPIRHQDGAVIGASTIARDITDRLRYREQLRFLAEHDALTGASNRRRFQRDLSDQVGRARRYGEQAALLIIDIDKFKQINDTHGHKAGDRALQQIASAITQRLRDTDAIARIGGDEFAVLLPYAGEAQAATIADDLRRVIGRSRLDLGDGRSLSLSASVGVALIGEDTASDDSVLGAADRAMYEDKHRTADSEKAAPAASQLAV